jgi:hypothetical protein
MFARSAEIMSASGEIQLLDVAIRAKDRMRTRRRFRARYWSKRSVDLSAQCRSSSISTNGRAVDALARNAPTPSKSLSRSASPSSAGATGISGKRARRSDTIVATSGAPVLNSARNSASGRSRTYARSAHERQIRNPAAS